ncbi:hypothetical protein OROHE_000821 [Orobanche hederae]
METIAAFRASFGSLSPCSAADRSGPGGPDVMVGSRTFLPNSWIQVVFFSHVVGFEGGH